MWGLDWIQDIIVSNDTSLSAVVIGKHHVSVTQFTESPDLNRLNVVL